LGGTRKPARRAGPVRVSFLRPLAAAFEASPLSPVPPPDPCVFQPPGKCGLMLVGRRPVSVGVRIELGPMLGPRESVDRLLAASAAPAMPSTMTAVAAVSIAARCFSGRRLRIDASPAAMVEPSTQRDKSREYSQIGRAHV